MGDESVHEFSSLAAQDRLSRSLSVQRTINVPIEVAFGMVSNFNEYPKWMPFCTSASVLSEGEAEASSRRRKLECEVGFGLETGTVLGTVGDAVRYTVSLAEPPPEEDGLQGSSPSAGPRKSR